jgi:uncharacterized protein with HEPN domain
MLHDDVRLQHMLDAAEKAVAFTKDTARGDLETNELLALALVRLVEILGEAANNVSTMTKDRAPHIPWK